jgi:ribonuclease Z
LVRYIDLVFLGTGGAIPSWRRLTSSIYVEDWNGARILLDAGEAAQLRLQEIGVSPTQIDLIAVTHAHGDHINGLPGLLQSMSVNKRTTPLTIVGSKKVVEFVNETLEVSAERLGFPVNIIAVEEAVSPSIVVYDKNGDVLELSWFKTCHTPDSFGFKLSWRLRYRIVADRSIPAREWIRLRKKIPEGTRISIVYTGDTAPCQTIVENSRRADVLVHEATFDPSLREEAHERLHSTSVDAAEIARTAGVSVLVLTHVSARYSGYEVRRLLEPAKRVFPRTVLAYDLMRIRLIAHIKEVPLSQILDAP